MRLTYVIRSLALIVSLTVLVLVSTATMAAAARIQAGSLSVSILDVTASGASDDLSIGDTLTFDIGLASSIGPIYGVGISVYGYDRNIVEFVNLETAATFLNETVTPGGVSGRGFANHASQDDFSIFPLGIADIVRLASLPRVELFQGISLSPISGDGSLDPGIGGALTGAGDVHARVTFRLIGEGITKLLIGSDPAHDGVILAGGARTAAVGTSYTIYSGVAVAEAAHASNPVPEPGPALLLALGLGVLAAGRPKI